LHRLVPAIGMVELPLGISSSERSHFAGGLDELIELMTSILTLAVVRKTGQLPSLRSVSNKTTTAICLGQAASVSLPPPLVFDGRFVKRMLGVWDGHTRREPEDACTYLHVTRHEYIVGIGSRDLVDAVANGDDAALKRGLGLAERVIGVWHGGS